MTKAKSVSQQDPQDEAAQASADPNESAAAQQPAPAADQVHDDSPEEIPAAPAPAPPPAPDPPKEKSVEQLAVERLRRNGYSDEAIDEALETYGPRAVLARTHRIECGDVGETGKHGDLGDNALLD